MNAGLAEGESVADLSCGNNQNEGEGGGGVQQTVMSRYSEGMPEIACKAL